MPAYYGISQNGCHVLTSAVQHSGALMWNPYVLPGLTYGVAQWNHLSDTLWRGAYKVNCPAHCSGCTPKGIQPPSSTLPPGQAPPPVGAPIPAPRPGPVYTGPDDPCAPAMMSRDDDDFRTDEHLQMPRVGEFHAVRHGSETGLTAEPGFTNGALYTVTPDVRRDGDSLHVVAMGTGTGYMVLHPSDLHEYQLRGDGVHPHANAWPDEISKTTLLLLNGVGKKGQIAATRLAFGMPTARPEADGLPINGYVVDLDLTDESDPVLSIQATDTDGAIDNVSKVIQLGDYTLPLEDGAAGQVLTTDGNGVVSWQDPS